MESDFVKVGTNQEDMRGGVQDHPNTHHIHCCHDASCPQACQDHGLPKEDNTRQKNEHTYPGEDNAESKGDHKGEYPGFIRKMR